MVRFNDVLVYDTITVCVDSSSAQRIVSALLPFQPADKGGLRAESSIRHVSYCHRHERANGPKIDSSTRGRLTEYYFEMKWFIDD